MRLFGELIAEAIDQLGRDLAQPVAAEEPLEIREPPAVVHVIVRARLVARPQRLYWATAALVDVGLAWCQQPDSQCDAESLGHPELLP